MNAVLNQEQERWMATLAGQPLPPSLVPSLLPALPPSVIRHHTSGNAVIAWDESADLDEDLQLAQLLREVMDTTPQPTPEPLDDATSRRVLNSLDARGSFDLALQRAAQARAVAAAPQALDPRLRRCWAAAGELASTITRLRPRVALAATALGAAWALALLLLPPGAPDFDEDTAAYAKSLPVATVPAVQHVQTRQPDAAAAQLLTVLAQAGIAAQVQPLGPDRLVQARLPVATSPELNAALLQLGLRVTRDATLVVQFSASRP